MTNRTQQLNPDEYTHRHGHRSFAAMIQGRIRPPARPEPSLDHHDGAGNLADPKANLDHGQPDTATEPGHTHAINAASSVP
ncbi:hypothetical protein GCM10009827_043490 [Dactylosporangium maewongense]|uniref:Uncharacterized protein n=1 Tax=Dactylosporangium maewongense TaxID=634393 RepID=A0ABN2AMW3_9ACTN